MGGEDYICLTDMLKAKDGDFFVTDWLRNRNTMEFLGVWESVHNPDFNYGEFATIKSQAGLNSFKIGVSEFAQRTNAKSIVAKAGRYGGTFAHKDIAFEFAMWISPEFKIYIVKEFQRLKSEEQKQLGWNVRRELSKINYRIHTDAIKQNLIPTAVTRAQMSIIYANEADVLNVALFGKTAQNAQFAAAHRRARLRIKVAFSGRMKQSMHKITRRLGRIGGIFSLFPFPKREKHIDDQLHTGFSRKNRIVRLEIGESYHVRRADMSDDLPIIPRHGTVADEKHFQFPVGARQSSQIGGGAEKRPQCLFRGARQ